MENEKYPMCHLYAQKDWADDGHIIANKEGLERLRDLIDLALEKGFGRAVFWPSDMEGYELYIACVSKNDINLIELPYTSDDCPYSGEMNKMYNLFPKKVYELRK